MLKNYLLVVVRNLKRTKLFSAVNILGLAIGMTASLLILHYVQYERSYDTFYEHSDRTYRLRYERTDESGGAVQFASCCPPAAARIRGTYPEVESIARMLQMRASVSYEDTKFLEDRIFFAEPEMMGILAPRFIEGDPVSGLSEPSRCFLSKSAAARYFGSRNPIGKSISIDKKAAYEVVGVFEDMPANSHVKFDLLLPWANLAAAAGPDYTESWGETGSYTYLIAKPGADPQAFERKLSALVEAECPWLKDYHMTIDLKMQPLTDIHLTSHFMQEHEANGDSKSVDILFLIALFIMLVAWVNFVNLSTAISIRRAKEVGLRKVVGASRGQLIAQFFFEIMLTNLAAVICTVTIIAVALPFYCQLTGMPTDYPIWSQVWFWLTLAGMFTVGVFLSGLYPVLSMSSFQPAGVLKGKAWNSATGIRLRKALVVFQFAVGLVLIIATATVYRQISFMRNQDLGFAIDQTLVVEAPRVRDAEYATKIEAFKQTLLQREGIEKVTCVTEVPGRQIYWDAGAIFKAGEDVSQSKNYQIVGVDYDFADVFELDFVAGRNFSRDFPTDTKALVLNETAVRQMGFVSPDSAIGQNVNYWEEIFPIIGVVKDFHQQSPKAAFEPHIFRYMPNGRGRSGMIALRITGENTPATIEAVRQQYDTFFPGNPFNFFFLDDYFDQQYASDEAFGRVSSLFSLLALVIIVLGIFGLSSFSVTQRRGEIGIRKVLGASTPKIVGLLTREYVILAAVANVIAWPIAWFAMKRWLEGFALHTNVGLMTFALAGFATLAIALLTVSYQVIKAALANPVDAIRRD